MIPEAGEATSLNIRFEEKFREFWGARHLGEAYRECRGSRLSLPIEKCETERTRPLRIHCILMRFECDLAIGSCAASFLSRKSC